MPAYPYENLHLDRMLSGFSTQLRNRPSIVDQLVNPIVVEQADRRLVPLGEQGAVHCV